MKTKKIFFILLIILLISSAFSWYFNPDKNLLELIRIRHEKIEKNIEKIKPMFKIYNPNIEDEVLEDLVIVMSHFDLDTNYNTQKLFISQILKESSGKHMKNGKLLTSSAGALGICQIKPSTAFHYLKYKITPEEKEQLYSIGVENFDWISDYDMENSVIPKRAIKKVTNWLKEEKNSFAIWAYMSQKNTNEFGIENAFVVYNLGKTGWKNYKKSGGKAHKHPYVKGIKKIFAKI